MKVIQFLLTVIGALAVCLAVAAAIYVFGFKGGEVRLDKIPVLTPEMLRAAEEMGRKISERLTWIMLGFAGFLQLLAWIAAAGKLREIRGKAMPVEARLMQLEAIGIYFDLPLYFGLLGTVLSFIVITIYPDAGLLFAYVSTALGIMVSVILRLFYLTPYQQTLIAQRKFNHEKNENRQEHNKPRRNKSQKVVRS